MRLGVLCLAVAGAAAVLALVLLGGARRRAWAGEHWPGGYTGSRAPPCESLNNFNPNPIIDLRPPCGINANLPPTGNARPIVAMADGSIYGEAIVVRKRLRRLTDEENARGRRMAMRRMKDAGLSADEIGSIYRCSWQHVYREIAALRNEESRHGQRRSA